MNRALIMKWVVSISLVIVLAIGIGAIAYADEWDGQSDIEAGITKVVTNPTDISGVRTVRGTLVISRETMPEASYTDPAIVTVNEGCGLIIEDGGTIRVDGHHYERYGNETVMNQGSITVNRRRQHTAYRSDVVAL